MKRYFSFIIVSMFLFLFVQISYAEILTPETKITRVTVYPGSARVTREATVDLTEGEHTVVFDNIIPVIDQNSLSIAGKGKAQVKLYGASFKDKQLIVPADERVSDIQQKIDDLNDQIAVQNAKLAIINQQREFIASIKAASDQEIPKEIMTKMPSPADLTGIFDFIGTGLQSLTDQSEAVRLETRRLAKEKDVLVRELSQLQGGVSKTKRSVEVELSCEKPGSFTVEASYLVAGPVWRPVYDARAQFDPSEVEMISFAMVKQNTGEDWSNVELSLSTVQPLMGGRMPYIEPWIVKPVEPVVSSPANVRYSFGAPRNMAMKSVADSIGEQYEAYDMSTASMGALMPEPEEIAAEVDYASLIQKGVSVVFNIARPATLASDGTERKFPVTTQSLKADYEYATFPKATALAYLGSRVINSDNLNLLAGEVNLFVEGDYIGKSTVDNVGPGETFDLYLGADENVKVKREMVKKEIDKTLFANIAAPNHKITYTYKFTVENYKMRDIKVKLFEAMPVAQDDRIKIKVFDVSVEPKEKDWKDRQGVWLWEFSLKPKEKKEIKYSFVIEYPKNMPMPDMD